MQDGEQARDYYKVELKHLWAVETYLKSLSPRFEALIRS